jgi:periplasmic divalent cation tolerance protein
MSEQQFIEITWTSGSLDEARKIARRLVEEKLVASALIIPWVESIYIWNDQLETSQESKVVLKTTLDQYELVAKTIREHCSYEVPEILYRKIDGGNAAYLDWVTAATTP